jgi:chemotaxis-related protein WspB
MLYLLFHLGGDRYVLEAQQILEILPMVSVRSLPQAPVGVAGVFNYRGAPVPLVDLSSLTLSQPSQHWFSTRIVLVRSGDHLLGLIIERATETIRREPSDFVASPVKTANTPYLGAVATDEHGLLQRIELEHLFSDDLREVLFGHSGEASLVANRD